MGDIGGNCGGSGVAVPCGDHANIDIGGEIAGDAGVPFLSGVNILKCPSLSAPNDGSVFTFCLSGVGASGTKRIGDKIVEGGLIGGETAPPLARPECWFALPEGA